MDDEMEGAVKIASIFTLWYFWVIIVGIGGMLVYYEFAPTLMNQETKVLRQSDSYVTTQQTALRTMRANYDKVATKRAELPDPKNAELVQVYDSQMKGIVLQMRQVADLIPDHIPPDIKIFLTSQKGG